MAEPVMSEAEGTTACPICGRGEPHHHNEREQAWRRLAEIAVQHLKIRLRYDPSRSYGGRAYVCQDCGAMAQRAEDGAYLPYHRADCKAERDRIAANKLLAVIGGKELPSSPDYVS